MCSRSKVTWYGHFCNFTKIASSCKQIAGSRPHFHTMVCRRARIHDVLKVKGHVIRALLWCHEMFAIQYGLTFCLYMRSLYETPLYSPSSISIRQLLEWATPSLTVWFLCIHCRRYSLNGMTVNPLMTDSNQTSLLTISPSSQKQSSSIWNSSYSPRNWRYCSTEFIRGILHMYVLIVYCIACIF